MSNAAKQSRKELLPLFVLLLVFLVLLLAIFAFNFHLLNQRSELAIQYLDLTTEIQVQTQQLANLSSQAANGQFDTFDKLRETSNIIDRALLQLRQGNPETRLSPSPERVHPHLLEIGELWATISENVNRILDRKNRLIELGDSAVTFTTNVPKLQEQSDKVVRQMIEAGSPATQIYVASRQLVLADRMLRRVGDILAGGTGAITATDALSRDASLFSRVMQGLINGDDSLNVAAVSDQEALEALADLLSMFEEIRVEVETVVTASTDFFEVSKAADEILLDTAKLNELFYELRLAYRRTGN